MSMVADSGRARFPGFVDVHVHFRDPGVPAAETTASGLAAARGGGFAAVVTMPNTSPACDSPALLDYQRGEAKRFLDERRGTGDEGEMPVILPSACITKGRAGLEVADIEALAAAGAAFFTDDGSYVADDRVMEAAMKRIAALGMVACQHALPKTDGVMRDCALARRLGLRVVPASAEADAIRRDISLCRVTGCRLHVQHISTAEGVGLVRDAQREGLPVTAEATPHHLLLSCDDLVADDANFKMAPPLGNGEDRAELRRAVKDGVLMFATDHAPHPAAAKSGGFASAANGIVGLETAIPITYGVMVEEEGMPVGRWAAAWHDMPLAILPPGSGDGLRDTVVEFGEPRAVDVAKFASLSRNCPYDGMKWRCWPCR
ncbi:MAG: amidohydrolase family protein [Kiritimatiellae bacterium]|nr:amidohydrolase family protein [Kiritimatiellia bacterium]